MTRNTETQKLRDWLKRALKISAPKFRVLWKELEKDGLINNVLDGHETKEGLLTESLHRLRFAQSMSKADRRTGRKTSKELSDQDHLSEYEQICASSVAKHLAYLADLDWDVRKVRERLLGGKTVSGRKAALLIRSPAARVMRYEDFEKHGVPILGHTATTEILPSLTHSRVEEDQALRFHITFRGKSVTFGYRRGIRHRLAESVELAVPIGSASGVSVCAWRPVWRGSVLDEVRILSLALAARYDFRVHEATWFVLTGAPPRFVPLLGLNSSSCTWPLIGPNKFDFEKMTFIKQQLDLNLAPWVSNRSVLSALEHYRFEALGKRDLRRPQFRTIKVLGFVSDALRRTGGPPDWDNLLHSWNKAVKTKAQWRYKNPSGLKTAYERAIKYMIMLQSIKPPEE